MYGTLYLYTKIFFFADWKMDLVKLYLIIVTPRREVKFLSFCRQFFVLGQANSDGTTLGQVAELLADNLANSSQFITISNVENCIV